MGFINNNSNNFSFNTNYIPIVSTFTNIPTIYKICSDLFKKAYPPPGVSMRETSGAHTTHSYKTVEAKDLFRPVALLVPFLGNIVVCIVDQFKHRSSDWMLDAIKKDPSQLLNCSSELLSQEQFITKALKANPQVLEFIDPSNEEYKKFASLALQRDWKTLKIVAKNYFGYQKDDTFIDKEKNRKDQFRELIAIAAVQNLESINIEELKEFKDDPEVLYKLISKVQNEKYDALSVWKNHERDPKIRQEEYQKIRAERIEYACTKIIEAKKKEFEELNTHNQEGDQIKHIEIPYTIGKFIVQRDPSIYKCIKAPEDLSRRNPDYCSMSLEAVKQDGLLLEFYRDYSLPCSDISNDYGITESELKKLRMSHNQMNSQVVEAALTSNGMAYKFLPEAYRTDQVHPRFAFDVDRTKLLKLAILSNYEVASLPEVSSPLLSRVDMLQATVQSFLNVVGNYKNLRENRIQDDYLSYSSPSPKDTSQYHAKSLVLSPAPEIVSKALEGNFENFIEEIAKTRRKCGFESNTGVFEKFSSEIKEEYIKSVQKEVTAFVKNHSERIKRNKESIQTEIERLRNKG